MKLICAIVFVLFFGIRENKLKKDHPSDVIEVYILAGQSNAVGYNSIDTYTPKPFPNSLSQQTDILFWPGSNANDSFKNNWITLQIGASSVSKKAFGPEITFGKTLSDANPKKKIAIIKYAVGGTSIARSKDYKDYISGFEKFDDKGSNWHPPLNNRLAGKLYNKLIVNINDALTSLKNQGKQYRIAGFIWMQGEHEAGLSQSMAAAYQNLLSDFLMSIRKDFNCPTLPVVIGQISDKWIFGHTVKMAQQKVCSINKHTGLVLTNDLPRIPHDDSHYTANGMVTLGSRFAKVMLKLQEDQTNSDSLKLK